jgi:hypothetical protein
MKSIVKYIAVYALAVGTTAACKFFFGPNPVLSGISPVMALALFGGFIARDKDKMFLLPLLALLLSDATIQFLYEQNLFPYAGFYTGQWKNYLLLMTIPLIGALLSAHSRTRILMSILAGPTLYFLISNLFVWMNAGEAIYMKDLNGLMQCYAMAIPFYRNSLLSTIVFLPMLLISYRNWVAVSAKRAVTA